MTNEQQTACLLLSNILGCKVEWINGQQVASYAGKQTAVLTTDRPHDIAQRLA